MRPRRLLTAGSLALALLASTAACSLPLPEGVQQPRGGPEVGESDPPGIQVMPPGPRDGAAPDAVVRGFLGAESSPEGSHQIARRFLSEDARWQDDQVRIYDPASLRITTGAESATAAEVSVSFTLLGLVDKEGRYSSLPRTPATETYRLVRDPKGQWRIADPPPGVRLTPADRQRSFPARRLYFLARTSALDRVVPDLLLLPADGPPGRVPLTRLLRGPSSALAGSVTTAFPRGTRLQSVVTRSSGIYVVTLSREVLRASDLERKALSAQLVWTLRSLDPSFRGLQVLAGSQPLDVPGKSQLQRPTDWDSFDPEGLAPGPAYFVAGDRVRTLAARRAGPAPPGSRALPARSTAVSPDRTRIAVLQPGPRVTVHVGDLDADRYRPALRAPGLSSPSWGRGMRGLWLLDGRGRVLLLRSDGRAVRVPVPGVPGRLRALVVSRDGVRAAFVIDGTLYVGRVDDAGGARPPRIVGAVRIARDLTGITRVVWRDPTTLVVLGTLAQTFVPVLVSVDGSSARPLPVAGLPARPQEVAASSLGIIVTAEGRLYLLRSGFVPGPPGRSPVYPG